MPNRAPDPSRPWPDPEELKWAAPLFVLGYRQAQNDATIHIERLHDTIRTALDCVDRNDKAGTAKVLWDAINGYISDPYRNDVYEERACDLCGKLYRGPAVYCCLKCALAALYVGLSVSSLRILVKAGDAPAPVRLTPGRLVWLRDDLDAWLDRRAGRAAALPAGNPWMEALAGDPG